MPVLKPNPQWLQQFGREAVGALRNLGADRSVVRKAIDIERKYPGVLGMITPKELAYQLSPDYRGETYITTPKNFLDLAFPLNMDDPWSINNIEYLGAVLKREKNWADLFPGERVDEYDTPTVEDYISMLGEQPPGFNDAPRLGFDSFRGGAEPGSDLAVSSHSARHRSAAALNAGVESIPLDLSFRKEIRPRFDDPDYNPNIYSEYDFWIEPKRVGRFNDLFKLPAAAPLFLDEEE